MKRKSLNIRCTNEPKRHRLSGSGSLCISKNECGRQYLIGIRNDRKKQGIPTRETGKSYCRIPTSKVRKNNGDQLSGGERRRTEIARCLAIDPKFIMLDEPFAGVDPIAVEDIQYIVWKLKDKTSVS